MLSGVNRGSPWAVDHVEGARNLLEDALGSYTSAFLLDWRLPGSFDAESAALHVAGDLMFGLMGVSLMIKSLQLLPLGLGFLPVVLAAFGLGVLGGTLMMMFKVMQLWPLAVVIVLFLVLCSLYKGLSYGVLFLLCRPLVVCTWVLII